ncbi:MAG: kelch repeat-containing protein [Betaproteobacteria bacterium]
MLLLLLAAAPALSQSVSDRANERAEVRLPADEAVTAGRLRVLGEYLLGRKAWTSTVLPEGSVLLFGDSVLDDAQRRSDGQPVITLRNRFDHGSEARVAPHAAPLLWRGDGKGWQRLPRPPGCKGNSFMPTATLMSDGRVLMAGGLCDLPRMADDTSPRRPHVATSIWSAANQAWESGPDLTQTRVRHSATLLPDGSVLLVGGHSDPALSGTAGNPAPAAVGPGAGTSADDRGESLPVLASVERFHAGRMQAMPPLSIARAGHTATLLQDGSVLVAGGRGANGEALNSAELWDAGTGRWLLLPPMVAARHAHSATRLSDGRVLVVGGESGGGPSPDRLLPSSEIFDPITRHWSPAPRLPRALREHATVLLGNGAVLLVGGRQFSPSPYSEPWAWVLDAGQQRWLPAGNATVSRYDEEWQVTPDLQPLADGRVRIFAGTRVLLWSPRPPAPEIVPPAWSRAPAAALLANGRVLVVGSSARASGDDETHVLEWDPQAKRWSAAAPPGFRVGEGHGLAQLRSGRIVHVGARTDGVSGHRLLAHCLQPPQTDWRACGEAALPARPGLSMSVGTLPDGRLAVVAAHGTGAIYDEERQAFIVGELVWQTDELGYRAPVRPAKPLARLSLPGGGAPVDVSPVAARFWDGDSGVLWSWRVADDGTTTEDRSAWRDAGPRMLWDPAKNLWTYILPRERMGGQAALLPDGCAISIDPPSVFDPTTAKVRWLPDPGIGLERGSGRVLVLPDGEIVAVGMPAGGVGPGLYQTRVGCAGFAADPDEALVVQARAVDDPRFRIATAPAAAAAPAVAAPASSSRLREFLSRWWPDEPLWVAAAVLLPLLAYLLLSRVVIPRVKAAVHQRQSPVTTGILSTRLPWPVAWGVRLLIYIPLAGLLLAWVGQLLLVREFNEVRMDHERCEVDPRACVDARTGLIASVPELEGRSDPGSSPQIPCRFVGVWSTRDSLGTYNVTLREDGRLRIDDHQPGAGRQTDGFWMVQGGHFVRRYPYPGQAVPDVRRVVPINEDLFELLTSEGDVSRFSLVERRESSRCVR